MRNLLEILLAHFFCDIYLVFFGIFKGQHKLVGYDINGKVELIAVSRGSFFNRIYIEKVFFKKIKKLDNFQGR